MDLNEKAGKGPVESSIAKSSPAEFVGIAHEPLLLPANEIGSKSEQRNPVLPPIHAAQTGLFLSHEGFTPYSDSVPPNHTNLVSTPSQAPPASTAPTSASSDNTGRWTALEHERFLEGLRLYGKVCINVF